MYSNCACLVSTRSVLRCGTHCCQGTLSKYLLGAGGSLHNRRHVNMMFCVQSWFLFFSFYSSSSGLRFEQMVWCVADIGCDGPCPELGNLKKLVLFDMCTYCARVVIESSSHTFLLLSVCTNCTLLTAVCVMFYYPFQLF